MHAQASTTKRAMRLTAAATEWAHPQERWWGRRAPAWRGKAWYARPLPAPRTWQGRVTAAQPCPHTSIKIPSTPQATAAGHERGMHQLGLERAGSEVRLPTKLGIHPVRMPAIEQGAACPSLTCHRPLQARHPPVRAMAGIMSRRPPLATPPPSSGRPAGWPAQGGGTEQITHDTEEHSHTASLATQQQPARAGSPAASRA